MSDLFTAGSDTTTNTLGWAFLYLLNYPDVQAKIRKELDRVIGSDRLPTLNDRKKYE
jgi:cytochrome P450